MTQEPEAAPEFYIWGVDNSAYGPVELPTLVHWIKDERVLGDTWVFVDQERTWSKACDLRDLRMFFRPKQGDASLGLQNVDPAALRRIKALSEMTDNQLRSLLQFIEIVPVRPFTHLVHRGEPGDAMFGVLEGELRSCIQVEGKECPLATLGPGSVFGEISLFDKGAHAADVLANEESLLMKISDAALARLSQEAPDAARALLFGLIKAIAGRVRTLTKRYEDSIHVSHHLNSAAAG